MRARGGGPGSVAALPPPVVIEKPNGRATMETYTVVRRREGPLMDILVGRDEAGLRVAEGGETNLFIPD